MPAKLVVEEVVVEVVMEVVGMEEVVAQLEVSGDRRRR